MTPRALIACANHWSAPVTVGDHHLARDLVRRGWDVAFISNPVSPLHLGRAAANRDRFRCYAEGGERHLDGRLWSYVPGAAIAPRSGWPGNRPGFLRHWWRATYPPIVRKVREEGFGRVELLYLREARQAFWIDRIEADRIVYRVADRDSGFAGYSPALREQEESIARRADLVVYTAADLRQYVEDLGARCTLALPNGVDYDHFQAPQARPTEYGDDPRPIAVYVGSIDVWLDRRLIEQTARALPEVRFVFIGPGELALNELANVEVLGPRPFDALPAYLQHATVGLIPFDVESHRELVNSVQPLKLLEYLAAGLPVVSTEWAAVAEMQTPATLCSSVDSFQRAIRAAVDGSTRGQHAESFRAFAAQHAWSARFDQLLEELALA